MKQERIAPTTPARVAPITPERIAIIGAGLMGHGIAFVLARAGHTIAVHDPAEEARQRLPERLRSLVDLLGADPGCLQRISTHADLSAAVAGADVVIEAAPEKLPLKQAIFAQLDRHAPAHAILASNTSCIPIGDIARDVRDRARVVGTHFWNPPHLVPLVEVVQVGPENLPAVEKSIALLSAAGWKAVHVKRDIPGFIGNRLQHALKREAIALVQAGVCDAETIDEVVKTGFGARLAVLGPLEQSDLVGLNLTLDIQNVLLHDLDCTRTPQQLLVDLVNRGNLGMKTGRGFRAWTPEQAQAVRDRLNNFLADAARRAANKTNETEEKKSR